MQNANPTKHGHTLHDGAEVLPRALSHLENRPVVPKLCVRQGPMKGETFDLEGKTFFIGRSSCNDIQIKDIMVSRKHLKISKNGETYALEDLRSTNGTLVNGKMIEPGECVEIKEGATITIGNTGIRFGYISFRSSLDVDELGAPCPEDHQKEKRSKSTKSLGTEKVWELFDRTLNVNGMLDKLLQNLLDALPRIDSAAVLVVDEQGRKIRELISKSRNGDGRKAVLYSRNLLNRFVKEGKTIKISDTTYEAKADHPGNMRIKQIRSSLCVPIVIKRRILGAIYLNSIRGPYDGFRKEDLRLLQSTGDLVALALGKSGLSSD